MDAIEFVSDYENFLIEIEEVIKPEYYSVIERMKEMDPHDLVSPKTWFHNERDARGFVWSLFLKEKMSLEK